MMNKKVVVTSCEECPYNTGIEPPIIVEGKMIYCICEHSGIGGVDISSEVFSGRIHPKCPLEDDCYVSTKE